MRFHLVASCLFPLLPLLHLLSLLPSLTGAQTVQSVLWNVPDGDLADLSQTFTSGTTLALSWNAFPYTNYIDATKTLVHLWVTSFDANLNNYSELLKENINLTAPGNFAWTIAIPPVKLTTSAKYVLRFKTPSSAFDPNTPDLSSPGFLVLGAAAVPTTTSSLSSSSSSTSSTSLSLSTSSTSSLSITPTSSIVASITPTTNPSLQSSSPTPTAPATSSPQGLSTTATAGIGAGAAVAVLALAGLAYFLFKRRRREIPALLAPSEPKDYVAQDPDKYMYSYPEARKPAELPVNWHIAELPAR